MRERAQWVVGEERFPRPQREFVHARSRMLGDALQHVAQRIAGIDIAQLARHQRALRDANLPCVELDSTEHPVLLANWNHAQRALQ